MMRRIVVTSGVFVATALGAAVFATAALAHHSFAMFDHEKVQKIAGTIKEFEYINPHAWLHIVTAGERPVTWSMEMGGTGQLTRDGWKRDSVKPGDKVTVEFHPLIDGSHGGQFLAVTFADGKVMCQAGAGNQPCKVGADHSTNLGGVE
jgi:hypothetical protein